MLSSPRLRLYRIIRPSLVLSQSFTDRLWCGQNEKWWIMGRSRDQFGPEGPAVSTSAACRSPAVRDQAKSRRAAGDPKLKLEAPPGTDSSQTPRWREADPNRRSQLGRRARFGPPRRFASLQLRAGRLIRRCSRDVICSARGYSALQCSANSSGVVLSAPPQFSSEAIGRSSSNRPRHWNAGVVECR